MKNLNLSLSIMNRLEEIAAELLQISSQDELLTPASGIYAMGKRCSGCSGTCEGSCSGNCDGMCIVQI